MAEAVAALTALAGNLASLVTNEVVRIWNLDEDLGALQETLNSIQALLSDSRDIPPPLESVRDWFKLLDARAKDAAAFLNELQSEAAPVNVKNPITRSWAARKIKKFQDSFDDIYKRARDLGFQPVEYLRSVKSSGQSRDMGSIPPIENESQIVGRYLVQTVSGNNEESLRVVVNRDVSNIEEASRARLHEKSHIRHLVLSWKNNEDGRGDREFNDEDVMKELKPHTYLKTLTVEGFQGKNFAPWIIMMTNLEEITLKDCKRCEVLPSLPTLISLEIKNCPRLRMTPNSFPSLKNFKIGNLESSMILETMSTNASSLTYLELKYITDGGGTSSSSSSSRSDMESVINMLLRNNSLSLTTLDLVECKGVERLTVGVSLEKLWVYDCPNLTSIRLDQGSAGLISLSIRKCFCSLLLDVSSQIQSCTLEKLKLGPFLGNLDEFPWPFSSSSSSNSFHNLYRLELFGWGRVKSRQLFEQLQSSTFPALAKLFINDFKELEALPDSLANFPCLELLEIKRCQNLKSLPMFGEYHSLEELYVFKCPRLKERCEMGNRPEWFKIQHIPLIKW
ncbi:hypothetical protein POM88_040072 [Heracleum sosnowskyi]|uniref:Rx N-terminal domain-containing protein n=1 Tax=Heracleum sosnowskyi TaxID=360622 RepID=A0AAD8HDE1_9APIA|nr:hypothetical protein POM88_040072 [Heracleum sosnowskyi]